MRRRPLGWCVRAGASSYEPPPGGALDTHPLMSITTGGRFTVRDLDLVVDEVDIGGACGTIKLVRPKSEDDVLDVYVEIGREDADPYWAALWPSSVALARGVAGVVMDVEGEGMEQAMDGDRSASLAGLNVCDVGAGLGLAGLAAAKRGATSVSFYDREPLALQCCLLSAEANGLTVAVGRAGEGPARDVSYGDDDDGKAYGTACVAEVFDWNAVRADQRTFDLVLACDVLYEAHAVAPVAALIPKLTNASSPRGRWMLADPPDRAPKNRAAFLERVKLDHGMELVRERRETVTRAGSTDDVLVLDLRLR